MNNTSNNHYFSEAVSFTVASVEFNYEYQILEKNSTVSQDTTLSVASAEAENFALYPNPAKNELYIKGIHKAADYSIHSIDGRLMKKDTYQPNKAIPISELIPGTYIFSINEKSIKFIKH